MGPIRKNKHKLVKIKWERGEVLVGSGRKQTLLPDIEVTLFIF